MILSNKHLNNIPPLFYNYDIIKYTSHHKVLGVTIDNALSFKYHINEVSRTVSMFYSLKDLMPASTLKAVYYAHVQPHINYCIALWGSTYSTHLKPLFIIQKKILRLITNSPYLEHSRPLFKSMGILNIYELSNLEISSYMFKHKNSDYFLNILHNYNTRNRNNLNIPQHSLTIFKHSLEYNGPKVWNNINQNIKDLPSIRSFRKKY